jgi:hypothetical protein
MPVDSQPRPRIFLALSALALVCTLLLNAFPPDNVKCARGTSSAGTLGAPTSSESLRDESSGTAAFSVLESVSSNITMGRWAWMHFPKGLGLQNNMAVLRHQHLAAKWSNRVLVLPRTMPSRGRLAIQAWHHGVPQEMDGSEWRDIPIELFLDVEYMRACTGRLGMHTLTSDEAEAAGVPPPVLLPDFGYRTLANIEESRLNPLPSVESARTNFVYELLSDHKELISQINAFDACLTYSPALMLSAARLATDMRSKFGVRVSEAVALHSRMEDDMLELFPQVGDLAFVAKRMIGKIQDCMLKVAPPSQKRPVFVLTGEPFTNEKYDALKATYGTLAVTKEDISPEMVADLHARNGLDAGVAIVDVYIAQEAGIFVGCFCSSLSVRIAQYRHKLGRPSYMYNGENFRKREGGRGQGPSCVGGLL